MPALLARLVERFRPRLAVIACNTASTIALDQARAALDIPVVGTVPAIKPAAALSARPRVIGVLGTEATVRQPYVDDLAARFAADCTVIRHGSTELVELAEAKLAGEAIDPAAIAAAVAPDARPPRRRARSTSIVLACTHFPLLADEIAAALPGVALVDGGAGHRAPHRLAHRRPALARHAAAGHRRLHRRRRPPALATALARFGLDEIATL